MKDDDDDDDVMRMRMRMDKPQENRPQLLIQSIMNFDHELIEEDQGHKKKQQGVVTMGWACISSPFLISVSE